MACVSTPGGLKKLSDLKGTTKAGEIIMAGIASDAWIDFSSSRFRDRLYVKMVTYNLIPAFKVSIPEYKPGYKCFWPHQSHKSSTPTSMYDISPQNR